MQPCAINSCFLTGSGAKYLSRVTGFDRLRLKCEDTLSLLPQCPLRGNWLLTAKISNTKEDKAGTLVKDDGHNQNLFAEGGAWMKEKIYGMAIMVAMSGVAFAFVRDNAGNCFELIQYKKQ